MTSLLKSLFLWVGNRPHKMALAIARNWRGLARFFESGDLVPFFVIISVAHYIPVLTAVDEHPLIAGAVGVAIDMLHFRAVRAWFKSGIRSFNSVIGVLTTVMAMLYHLRFYDNDWLLAAPIPLGIAILAYQMSDHKTRATAVATFKAQLNKLQPQIVKLQAENDSLRTQRDRLKQERDRLTRRASKGYIEVDKLPPALADYAATVAAGKTPDGPFTKRWSVGVSTLKRANSMLLGREVNK